MLEWLLNSELDLVDKYEINAYRQVASIHLVSTASYPA